MFIACKECGCLTAWGTVLDGEVYCEYCIKEKHLKEKKTKPIKPEYQTFLGDFKKRWPTMSAFARQYNFKSEMVQRTLNKKRKGKLTKTQERVMSILIKKGFAKIMIIEELISVEDVIRLGSIFYK